MQFALLGSILVMGFLGSWHCGVMCGPLSCNFRKKSEFFSYHLGRLLSYIGMASLLFYGFHFLTDVDSRGLRVSVGFVFGVILILFGLNQVGLLSSKAAQFRVYKLQVRILERFKFISKRFPIVLGLLTGLFPCGWLYSFLFLSTQFANVGSVCLVIFLFWLTSLPAFIVITGFMQQLIKKSPVSYQKISALVLILAGLFSIFGHWVGIVFNQVSG